MDAVFEHNLANRFYSKIGRIVWVLASSALPKPILVSEGVPDLTPHPNPLPVEGRGRREWTSSLFLCLSALLRRRAGDCSPYQFWFMGGEHVRMELGTPHELRIMVECSPSPRSSPPGEDQSSAVGWLCFATKPGSRVQCANVDSGNTLPIEERRGILRRFSAMFHDLMRFMGGVQCSDGTGDPISHGP